jgi:hypothetical protein
MPSPYQVLIQSAQNLTGVRGDLAQALRATGARVDVSKIDAEDAVDAQRFFRLSPNFSADISQIARSQDGAVFAGVLSWAQGAGADIAILLDWELIAALRGGVLQVASSERQFFAREVLPSFRAPMSWVRRM